MISFEEMGWSLLTSFSLLLPKCLIQWCIAERKAHRALTCLLTYEIMFPLYTEFAHYSLLCIISTMGVIVFFSLPSHFWAWALLCPLAVLVQNKRHMPWLTFSGGPWDSSDYKRLRVMAPAGRGVPGVWKQSGVIWAIKDMTRYAAAVKFLNQCQRPDAVPCSVHQRPRELMALSMNPRNRPVAWDWGGPWEVLRIPDAFKSQKESGFGTFISITGWIQPLLGFRSQKSSPEAVCLVLPSAGGSTPSAQGDGGAG